MQIPTPTYGLELEKTFSGVDGSPHAVGKAYFERLAAMKQERGENSTLKHIGVAVVGVSKPYGEEGLDNSFGLGESATGPIAEVEGGLNKLSEVVNGELRDVLASLALEDATVINMSNHPLTLIIQEVYDRTVAPKPVYGYMRNVRGWNHIMGINGKSQNSPSVGVSAEHAVRAVNVMLGLGAGLIALYANSPFEEGAVTGIQESRLALWDGMFGRANSAGDRRLYKPPEQPFNNLRDYFYWMFGPDTNMYFVVTAPDGGPVKNEKGEVRLVRIDGDPSLLEYMKGEEWNGKTFETEEPVVVKPTMDHFQMHQFTQFTGARIRYGLKDEPFPVIELVAAMEADGNEVDELFARKGAYFYIEGRDPGANFPDKELLELPDGDQIARSVIISPAAIHAGLIRNIDAAEALVAKYGWKNLIALRDDAIKNGMDAKHNNVTAQELCHDILEVARAGLHDDELWMLAYPEFVARTGLNGATRALEAFNSLSGPTADRIKQITEDRAIVLP